eukprot:scaffold21665_cov60-Cyclotella_meneghiniana.AAC.2
MAALRRLRTSGILLFLLGFVRQQSQLASAFVTPQSSAMSALKQNGNKLQHATYQQTHLHLAGVEDLWSSYLSALDADPLLVKSVTAGVILGAADLAGQSIQQSMSDDDFDAGVDIARFLRFAFFGFILQAPWNHFYYLLLDGALPPTEDPFTATTGIKVVIDQFVQAPIFTVIIFVFLGTLEGKTLDDIKKQLDEDYSDTMIANWKLWVPATAINIAFCPPILRVLFLNVVFFFWSIFLSLKLNKGDSEEV